VAGKAAAVSPDARRPHFSDDAVTIHHGDCLDVLAELPDASVDAVVTDPPYGLGFMGQKWDTYANETGRAPAAGAKFDHVGGNHNPSNAADAARTRRIEGQRYGAWCEQWAAECLRLLKPGGHLLAFGGSRTWHRLACAVEDAGFEIRDSIFWIYGSGFPKSSRVSRDERFCHCASNGHTSSRTSLEPLPGFPLCTSCGKPNVDGLGTALKPSAEPIVVARKPLSGTVAANVLAHGTGALNVDGARVGTGDDRTSGGRAGKSAVDHVAMGEGWNGGKIERPSGGRWPANVLLDGDAAAELDGQSGWSKSTPGVTRQGPGAQRRRATKVEAGYRPSGEAFPNEDPTATPAAHPASSPSSATRPRPPPASA
jgi:hypothetical protein